MNGLKAMVLMVTLTLMLVFVGGFLETFQHPSTDGRESRPAGSDAQT